MRTASIVLACLVFAAWSGLSPQRAHAEDEALLSGVIPGAMLEDGELAEIHGRGVLGTRATQSSLSGPLDLPNLRESLMGIFKSAGVRPPLAPSGPNGVAGGGPITIPRTPSVPAIRSHMLPSVRTPRVPSMGASLSGSNSSFGTSTSSTNF